MKLHFIVLLLSISVVNAKPYHAKSILTGGKVNDGQSSTITNKNEFYSVGFFKDGLTFNDTFLTCSSSSFTLNAIFLTKVAQNDSIIYVKKIAQFTRPTTASNYPMGIKIIHDNKGNLYIAYNFEDTINVLGHTAKAKSGYDGLLIKLDSNGNYLWHTTVTGTNNQIFGLDNFFVDKNNNVVISGSFGTLTKFSNDSAIFNTQVIANPSGDFFIAKYNELGSLIYLHNNNAFNHWVEATGTVACPDGGYFIYGYLDPYYQGSFQSFQLAIPALSNDAYYIIKYDSFNQPKFVKTFSSSGFGNSTSIRNVCVLNNNQIILYGINDYLNSGSSVKNHFTASYDSVGNLLWNKPMANGSAKYQPYTVNYVVADKFSNGYYSITTTYLDYISGHDTLQNVGLLLEYLDSTGIARWHKSITNKYVVSCSNFKINTLKEIVITGMCRGNKFRVDAIDVDLAISPSFSFLKLAPGEINWNDTLTNNSGSISTEKSSLKLFPNPASDKINLFSQFEIMKISVSNILGKTIEIPIEKQSNNNAILDTEMLPSGVYIITVTDKFGKSTMQKLIKV